MRYFFHADAAKYKRRLKSLLIIVIMPLVAVCVFCTVNIVLHFPTEGDYAFALLMLAIIAGCVALGIIFAFAAAYFTEKLSRRHSRYTYFDILPCGMVYSLYAGEFVRYGKRQIYRRLWYIPFRHFERTERDPKTDPCAIRIKGEIHAYLLPSDSLGYHVTEDGEMSFDHRELNDRGFERTSVLEIKGRFGSTKALERSIEYYAEQFKNRPEKKPFDISEHISVKKKKRPTTSNPALEAPSFDRKW